ncbi:MAG: cation transporter [Paludibacteraceae bacterium]|nr:cation transporter [Paludibacteraceae bacterium]
MKRIVILLLALMPMMAFAVNKQKVVLSCDLHCQGCCDKIMKNIAFEKGVKDLVCDLESKTVTVTYDADKTDISTLLKAFEKIGKPAQVKDDKTPKEDTPDTDANTGASTSSL